MLLEPCDLRLFGRVLGLASRQLGGVGLALRHTGDSLGDVRLDEVERGNLRHVLQSRELCMRRQLAESCDGGIDRRGSAVVLVLDELRAAVAPVLQASAVGVLLIMVVQADEARASGRRGAQSRA